MNRLDVNGAIAIGSYAGTTAPTNRLIVSGNVGIGTTGPADSLVVWNQSTGGNIRFGGANGRTLSAYVNNGQANFDFQAGQTYFSGDLLVGGKISSPNGSATNLYLTTNDTSKAIYTDRNVGIGTSNPSTKLSNSNTFINDSNNTSVNTSGFIWSGSGAGYIAGMYNSANVAGANGLIVKGASNASTSALFAVDYGSSQMSAGTPLFRVFGNGNVGIGTTNPLNKLMIIENTARTSFTGTGVGTALLANTAGTSNFTTLDFGNSGSSAAGVPESRIGSIRTASGSFMYLGTSNNYANGITNNGIVLDPNGNLGIGTTSPQALLHSSSTSNIFRMADSDGIAGGAVASMIDFYATSTLQGRIGFSTSVGVMQFSNYYGNMSFSTSSSGSATERMRINNAGGIAVGTYASSNTPPVDGMIISGDVGIGTSSPTSMLHISKDSANFEAIRLSRTGAGSW